MAEKKLTNATVVKEKAAARKPEKQTDDAYVIPNEVSCSPEFPQGCVSAE